MIAGTDISRLVLCPVQPDEDGEVQDVYEPTVVPFRENGKEEMELAREMAQKMTDADKQRPGPDRRVPVHLRGPEPR